ncbi:MAG: transcription elongation factor GreAB [Bermanella sp.]
MSAPTHAMNKHHLRQAIIQNLQQTLASAVQAAQQAHDAATHEQSKAETQYDTLGLESAYLAAGQSRRIDEMTLAISQLQNWSIKDFNEDEEIYLGALLTLNAPNQQTLRLFLAPAGGGISIPLGADAIKVITPQTPLGRALLGLGVEDTVTLPNGASYEVSHLQ